MGHNNTNAPVARFPEVTRPKLEGGRRFVMRSDFAPAGDQPTAIAQLVEGVQDGEAFQTLLAEYPENRSSATLIQIAAPSRESVDAYADLRRDMEADVTGTAAQVQEPGCALACHLGLQQGELGFFALGRVRHQAVDESAAGFQQARGQGGQYRGHTVPSTNSAIRFIQPAANADCFGSLVISRPRWRKRCPSTLP